MVRRVGPRVPLRRPRRWSTREFAKDQLILLLREWYMHPNGQLPAYEWAFGDVNPPVHAWAALRVYKIEKRKTGRGDREFLERVFHKLLLNFPGGSTARTTRGNNVFQGGFLGLDNIGVFDRSAPLPDGRVPRAVRRHELDGDVLPEPARHRARARARGPGLRGRREQVLRALRLHRPRDAAHGRRRASASGTRRTASSTTCSTCPTARHDPDQGPLAGRAHPALRRRDAATRSCIDRFPGFKRRMQWFIDEPAGPHRVLRLDDARTGRGERGSSSRSSTPEQLRRVLRLHARRERVPLALRHPRRSRGITATTRTCSTRAGVEHRVDYEPASRRRGLFGGNSNWRGPIWFPVNYLIIESLQKFHQYLGDDFKVECPTGSGHDDDAAGGRQRARAAAVAHLPARRGRAAARSSAASRSFQSDPALARPRPLPRVLPRRHRRRASARATRPAGPGWSPSCWTSSANPRQSFRVS